MKTKQLLLALSCLLLCADKGHAELNLSVIHIPPPGVDFIQAQRSYMTQIPMKNNWKTDIRQDWNGQRADSRIFSVMRDPNLRAIWDISDEQYQQLQDVEDNIDIARQNDPEYQTHREEVQAMLDMMNPDDPFPLNADEETMDKWLEISERGSAWMTNYYSNAIRSILTPEQQQKIQELQLVRMEDIPIVSPYLFEALGLTDEQKQQMEEIQEELETEFESQLEDFVNGQLFLVSMAYDELEKLGVKDIDGMMEEWDTVISVLAENPEYKQVMDEAQSRSKQFSTQFRTRLYEVLTDEQWIRLQDLINNPPEHILAFRKAFRLSGGDEETAEMTDKPDVWVPGPNSWRPGDPIPEEYRIERNRRSRFPRGEE